MYKYNHIYTVDAQSCTCDLYISYIYIIKTPTVAALVLQCRVDAIYIRQHSCALTVDTKHQVDACLKRCTLSRHSRYASIDGSAICLIPGRTNGVSQLVTNVCTDQL